MDAVETVASQPPPAFAPRAPFEVGELVAGHYIVRQLLGRGGMSVVYEADDTLLRRRVALKVVDDAADGGDLLLQEARALAAFRHPGLPAIYGVHAHRGMSFLVLERLFGVTLEQRLVGRGSIPVDEALTILISLADILAAIHASGVVHRDLKPGNVMLCAEERVVLLDFGIMLPRAAAAELARCGTPRYLAPEVILGTAEASRIHLVDVYALGVMAFEVVTGRPPFDAVGLVPLLEQHVMAPRPRADEGERAVPKELADVIDAMLARQAVDRPPAEAVAWELRSIAKRLDGARRAARRSGAYAAVDVAPSDSPEAWNQARSRRT
jgi:serine/threonine protein kinase